MKKDFVHDIFLQGTDTVNRLEKNKSVHIFVYILYENM